MTAVTKAGRAAAKQTMRNNSVAVDRIELYVPGKTEPWTRARRNGNRHFLAAPLEAYYDRIRAAWVAAGSPRIDGTGALSCSSVALLARPKKHLNQAGALNAAGRRSAYPTPDLDNTALKAPFDALNGLAWDDDRQFVLGYPILEWADGDCAPGLYLRVWPAGTLERATALALHTWQVAS